MYTLKTMYLPPLDPPEGTSRTILTVFLTLSLAMPALAADYEHTFDVTAGGELRIDSDLGSIEVRSGGGDRVEVEVEASGANAEDFDVEFKEEKGAAIVLGHWSRSRSWFGRSPRVKFYVTVPSRFDVDLETAGGSIEVDDIEGEIRAKTSGGSLKFGDIRGPVYARTSGGSITVRDVAGHADLHTSGGSIRVEDVDGDVEADTSGGSVTIGRVEGEVEASTSGGSIRIDEVGGTVDAETSGGSVTAYITEQPADDCRLTTSGGSVTVYLAEGVAVDLDARAGSGGRTRSDFELDDMEKTRTSLSGRINGGGPQLYLRSSGGGGVEVRRR